MQKPLTHIPQAGTATPAGSYDVLVTGGGNAALCAAIAARQGGASVLVLEAAPKFYRGGNTRHTRNLRLAHDEPNEVMAGAYPEEEFWDDLKRVTNGQTNEELARLVIRESKYLWDFLGAQNVRFQPPFGGTLSLDRTNAFFMGGGRTMLNSLYRAAERLGVQFRYDTEVTGLHVEDGRFLSAVARCEGVETVLDADALVAAAGGFEADIDWLAQYWGEPARNFLIRGTPYNRGSVLRMLLESGVQSVGDPTQCHAVAIDARSPRFDGGIVTRLDCIVFGIVVNAHCERFYDEGEDFWPKRYAVWGRLVAAQPGQIAFIIIDSKSMGLFMPSVYPPVKADSIAALAAQLDLDPLQLEARVAEYNDAVRPGKFDPAGLDDCRTEGITPPKTHWARTIDQPPYYAYPMRPGITFTYLATRVDAKARVIFENGAPAENIFAAGEIMAGNVLGEGYLAGIGMTIGSVFGRIAGQEAATYARQ